MTPREFYDLLEGLRRPGGHEPKARLADMDADGIDGVVLYPSLAMFFGPTDEIPALHDVEFVADCQRAYNDWLAEFCGYEPSRLSAWRRCPYRTSPARAPRSSTQSDAGCGPCSCDRPRTVDDLPLNHHVYDDFWSTCERLDVPVAFHPAVHVDTPGACRKFGLVAVSENTQCHEHGDGRDPRRFRTRSGSRESRRHDRH